MSDVIDRQAAIDAVHKAGIKEYDETLAIEEIERVPSAQPERKKGCKIVKSTGRYGYCACDQCDKPVHPEDLFCSKCGADMKKEDT